ncbi:hypothetical protein KAR34_08180 [bacterium]|nr:hypothetical protein [bacterium]
MSCWTINHINRQQLLCWAVEHNLLPEFVAEWLDRLDNTLRRVARKTDHYYTLVTTRHVIF